MIGYNPKKIGKNARRKKVCFIEGDNCCAKYAYVKVKRCPGNFLVYQLPAPPSGSYRYCGQKGKRAAYNYSKRMKVSDRVVLSNFMTFSIHRFIYSGLAAVPWNMMSKSIEYYTNQRRGLLNSSLEINV